MLYNNIWNFWFDNQQHANIRLNEGDHVVFWVNLVHYLVHPPKFKYSIVWALIMYSIEEDVFAIHAWQRYQSLAGPAHRVAGTNTAADTYNIGFTPQ